MRIASSAIGHPYGAETTFAPHFAGKLARSGCLRPGNAERAPMGPSRRPPFRARLDECRESRAYSCNAVELGRIDFLLSSERLLRRACAVSYRKDFFDQRALTRGSDAQRLTRRPQKCASLVGSCRVNKSWFRRPKLVTEVVGDEIIVTMPGSSFKVTYMNAGNGHLVANSFELEQDSRREDQSCLPEIPGARVGRRKR